MACMINEVRRNGSQKCFFWLHILHPECKKKPLPAKLNTIYNTGFVLFSSIVFLSSVEQVPKDCQWLGFIWCLLARSHHLLIIRAVQNMSENSPSHKYVETLHRKVLITTHCSHFSSYAALK